MSMQLNLLCTSPCAFYYSKWSGHCHHAWAYAGAFRWRTGGGDSPSVAKQKHGCGAATEHTSGRHRTAQIAVRLLQEKA